MPLWPAEPLLVPAEPVAPLPPLLLCPAAPVESVPALPVIVLPPVFVLPALFVAVPLVPPLALPLCPAPLVGFPPLVPLPAALSLADPLEPPWPEQPTAIAEKYSAHAETPIRRRAIDSQRGWGAVHLLPRISHAPAASSLEARALRLPAGPARAKKILAALHEVRAVIASRGRAAFAQKVTGASPLKELVRAGSRRVQPRGNRQCSLRSFVQQRVV